MLTFPPDITFAIQLVSFFVLLWILNRLLFAPFGALLAERIKQTEGASKSAAGDRTRAETLAAEIEEKLAQSRREAMAEAEAIRRDAREREAVIFNAAKADATSRLTSLRKSIESERQSAERTLRDDAKALARAMVDAVLTTSPRRGAR
jgi:F-type H+-transporting ATPase subunit b